VLTRLALLAILALASMSAPTGSVTLAWDPSPEQVAGYKLLYGSAPGVYVSSIDVGLVTQHTVSQLPDGRYYFVASAYSADGLGSNFSNEIVVDIPLDGVPTPKAPSAPKSLRIILGNPDPSPTGLPSVTSSQCVGFDAGPPMVESIPHTTAGTNRAIYAFIGWYPQQYHPVGLQRSGASFTKLGRATYEDGYTIEAWRLIAPTLGTDPVEVTWSNDANRYPAVMLVSVANVHQTTPERGPAVSAMGNGIAPTITVPTETGDLVLDGVFGGANWSTGDGQTRLCGAGTLGSGQTSYRGGTSGGIMHWTSGEPAPWAQIGVSIRPAQ
jgi:hypothetical protein